MDFLEKDLEEIIFENLQSREGLSLLSERGLDCTEPLRFIKRQFDCGNHGTADIVCFEKPGFSTNRTSVFPHLKKSYTVIIFELKRGTFGVEAIGQSLRYGAFFKEAARNKGVELNIEYYVIGRKFDRRKDALFLYENIPSVYLYEYEYGINGLSFNFITKHKWIMGGDCDSVDLPKAERALRRRVLSKNHSLC